MYTVDYGDGCVEITSACTSPAPVSPHVSMHSCIIPHSWVIEVNLTLLKLISRDADSSWLLEDSRGESIVHVLVDQLDYKEYMPSHLHAYCMMLGTPKASINQVHFFVHFMYSLHCTACPACSLASQVHWDRVRGQTIWAGWWWVLVPTVKATLIKCLVSGWVAFQ